MKLYFLREPFKYYFEIRQFLEKKMQTVRGVLSIRPVFNQSMVSFETKVSQQRSGQFLTKIRYLLIQKHYFYPVKVMYSPFWSTPNPLFCKTAFSPLLVKFLGSKCWTFFLQRGGGTPLQEKLPISICRTP